MKRFYDVVAGSLDPSGFTLYRMAKEVTGIEVTSLFHYEDARGMFEEASGHQLMDYLTAGHILSGAVPTPDPRVSAHIRPYPAGSGAPVLHGGN